MFPPGNHFHRSWENQASWRLGGLHAVSPSHWPFFRIIRIGWQWDDFSLIIYRCCRNLTTWSSRSMVSVSKTLKSSPSWITVWSPLHVHSATQSLFQLENSPNTGSGFCDRSTSWFRYAYMSQISLIVSAWDFSWLLAWQILKPLVKIATVVTTE